MIDYEVFMASCPHCGAPVTDKVCPYCGSILGVFLEESERPHGSSTSLFAGYTSRITSFAAYDPTLKVINRCADDILSVYSKHSDAVYDFMEKNKIGHSEYGRIMDMAAKGKHTMVHRLYGHHVIYDFPIRDREQIAPFLKHLASDFFTKMGLPIIPGEILNDVGMLKWCGDLTHNWNFINGFDVLSGTVAMIQSIHGFRNCFSSKGDERSVRSLAAQIGIGTFELLLSASTYNPFLLIGGLLTLTSGTVGLIRQGTRAKVDYGGNRLIVSI